MALVVSAETARTQINTVVFQAETCKANFKKFLEITSLSIDIDSNEKLRQIEDCYSKSLRSCLEFLKQLGSIKDAHQHLPEWKGKNGKVKLGQPKEDNPANLYTTIQGRINTITQEIVSIHRTAVTKLGGQVRPNDALFIESAPA